jgi:hypothetical protein
LGEATADTNGYKLALEGTNFKLYATENVDLSALEDIHEETFVVPSFCTVSDGEVCAFFEAPNSWSTVKCWAWDATNNYTGGEWPGVACTKIGTYNGKKVWKWSYSGSLTTLPQFIIFNNANGQQTADLNFKNGGYYDEAGSLQGVATGIEPINTKHIQPTTTAIYTLSGQRVIGNPRQGIYIVNGKKYVVR